MTLGQYLKFIRKSKKIKLVRFAEQLGVSISVVSRYEGGKTAPAITSVENMFDALGFRLVAIDKQILPE